MHFSFTDEQQAIDDTARELLANREGSDGLWSELCELGWPGIAVTEEQGGQGLGLVELAILAERLGYACALTPFLGTTLAALAIERAGSDDQRARWLAPLAAGRMRGALAIAGDDALIPDATPDGLLILVSPNRVEATCYETGGVDEVRAIDPGRRHGRVSRRAAGGEPLAGEVSGVIDRACVVVAAELVGLCRRALDLTTAYVKERRQFGVPVGSYQAVQHTAVEMLRDTELARTAVYHAAWTADADPDRLPMAAPMAKAAASDAGRFVTAQAIQLHGGMGFTWEAGLHWLLRRAQVNAAYLGGATTHRARIAQLLGAGPITLTAT